MSRPLLKHESRHSASWLILDVRQQQLVELLERIIQASSNEGDVVLDPFCGCGTTIAEAQKLGRTWIGIDVTHLSVGLMKLRLKDTFGLMPVGEKKAASPVLSLKGTKTIAQGKAEGRHPGNESRTDSDPEGVEQTAAANIAPLQGAEAEADISPGFHPGLLSSSPSATGGVYRVVGQPEDLDGAKELAIHDRYGFQWWILPLIGARALGAEKGQKEGKKGSDKGIDGIMVFTDDNSGKAKRVIVSVKSGHVNVTHIRDLGHVIDRENAAMGVYLTLESPTKPMIEEAAGKGFYHSPGWNKDYPRLQILTVEDMLAGKSVDLPPNLQTFKSAEKMVAENKDQGMLGFE